YHILQVTEETTEVDAVHLRHVLLATSEEAQTVLSRLQAGEDFAAVAREVSRDLSAAGSGGDSLMIASNGQARGAYTVEQMVVPIADAVFAADVNEGDIIGPLETEFGFLVIQIESLGLREPNPERLQLFLDDFMQRWEAAETRGTSVQRSEAWQSFVPSDPLPSDVDEQLATVDTLIAEAAAS
ncbi:MAG: peptidylprolyl isomerase, partial [Burkholderiales bacterium]|nr:peptidylprolyl isomerase [Anaerolineae bacterium]